LYDLIPEIFKFVQFFSCCSCPKVNTPRWKKISWMGLDGMCPRITTWTLMIMGGVKERVAVVGNFWSMNEDVQMYLFIQILDLRNFQVCPVKVSFSQV